MGTHRIERLQEEIRQVVSSALLFGTEDPLVRRVTVTRIMLTKDVSLARIYYELTGTAKEKKEVQATLYTLRGMVRKKLSENLTLKFLPQIEFFYDETSEEIARVESLFKKIS